MLEETAPPNEAPTDLPSTESGSMYVRVFKKVLPLLPIVAGTMIADQFSTNLLIPIKVQFFAPADVYAASGGCSASAVASLPAACIDAQNKAEVVTASLNGAQTLIGLCILPLLGRYSDAYGRRPLLIWSSLVSLLSIFVLWMTQAVGLSLYAYFASEFLARFQVFTIIFLAYVSIPSRQSDFNH
jgi:MFS family permease